MPTFDSEAAGSMPRIASRARALIAERYAKSESLGSLGCAKKLLQLRDQRRVRVEHAVHVGDVPSAELRTQQLRIAVVAVSAAEALVVGDVAR